MVEKLGALPRLNPKAFKSFVSKPLAQEAICRMEFWELIRARIIKARIELSSKRLPLGLLGSGMLRRTSMSGGILLNMIPSLPGI